MMREQLDHFAQAIRVQPLDRRHDGSMKGAPPILQQAAIGDIVGERMLERIFQIWEQPCLVQELRRLKF
jgi:hypothetical protein